MAVLKLSSQEAKEVATIELRALTNLWFLISQLLASFDASFLCLPG